jgi:hypothetical protein
MSSNLHSEKEILLLLIWGASRFFIKGRNKIKYNWLNKATLRSRQESRELSCGCLSEGDKFIRKDAVVKHQKDTHGRSKWLAYPSSDW